MRRAAALVALALLAACGKRGDLAPKVGERTPPAPYGTTAAPTVAQMQVQSPEAAPERADDPVKSAKPRADDRFALPPPG